LGAARRSNALSGPAHYREGAWTALAHWIVVRGSACVTTGEETQTVHENELTYIPIGAKHRLENPGKIDFGIDRDPDRQLSWRGRRLVPQNCTAPSRAQTVNTVIITSLGSASIEFLDLPFSPPKQKTFERSGDHLAHRGNRKTEKRPWQQLSIPRRTTGAAARDISDR
jgi:Mannose-6-phosphate isomerase